MNKNNRKGYLCQCDCGVRKNIQRCHLISGKTVSCGCYRNERLIKASIKHGMAPLLKSHRPRLYNIWGYMKTRCYNSNAKNYKDYGGRGITVCKEWKEDFKKFQKWAVQNGYQDNLEIERINNNGNYEPDNCKWATRQEQLNNTRRNINIEINGEMKNLMQWSELTGINYGTLFSRYSNGEQGEYLIRPTKSR